MGEMDKSRELYSKEGDNSSQFEEKNSVVGTHYRLANKVVHSKFYRWRFDSGEGRPINKKTKQNHHPLPKTKQTRTNKQNTKQNKIQNITRKQDKQTRRRRFQIHNRKNTAMLQFQFLGMFYHSSHSILSFAPCIFH